MNDNDNNKSHTDDSNLIEGNIDNIGSSVFDIGSSMSLIRVNRNNDLLI